MHSMHLDRFYYENTELLMNYDQFLLQILHQDKISQYIFSNGECVKLGPVPIHKVKN